MYHVMFINAQRVYERPNFSLRLENNLRHQTSRTSIETVLIGRIYLVILAQNKAEVNICGVEFPMSRFLVNHRK